ncbi:MAG: EF-hand domain-containing protein [Akkermansiaceae bacterium]|nr:EF-hand domain-containing protein [Akkermansiaceae bacterium]
MLPLLGMVSCATTAENAPPIHRKMLLLVERFDQFDEDGDGYLSRMELEKGVNSMGPDRLTQEQFDRAMLVYDTNGDNRVSRAEAKAAAANGPVLFEN